MYAYGAALRLHRTESVSSLYRMDRRNRKPDADAASAMPYHAGSGADGAARPVLPLRIMLVDDTAARSSVLAEALADAGHRIVGRYPADTLLVDAVAKHRPDLIILELDAPGRDVLESLDQLNRENPHPIVLFASRSDAETTRRAVRAGVSAYVVAGLHPQRISPIIEMAIVRFEQYQEVRHELDRIRGRMDDQQDIDRAKQLLMQRRQLGEVEAFRLLRKTAMDRKQRIGDLARQLIAVAEAL
jgi:response regulator NasT